MLKEDSTSIARSMRNVSPLPRVDLDSSISDQMKCHV